MAHLEVMVVMGRSMAYFHHTKVEAVMEATMGHSHHITG
jgi:hypothetical protein